MYICLFDPAFGCPYLWACHSHVSPSVADCSLIPESYDDDQPEEQRQINHSANWGPRHQEAFWHRLWHRVFEPSVLQRCWLGGRKSIRPVKKLSGAGMVICLEQGADLHMSQLMPMPLTVSCFSKIQIDFTFLVPASPGSPGQRAVKRLCVCVWHGVLRYSPVVNLCNMFCWVHCTRWENALNVSFTVHDDLIKHHRIIWAPPPPHGIWHAAPPKLNPTAGESFMGRQLFFFHQPSWN